MSESKPPSAPQPDASSGSAQPVRPSGDAPAGDAGATSSAAPVSQAGAPPGESPSVEGTAPAPELPSSRPPLAGSGSGAALAQDASHGPASAASVGRAISGPDPAGAIVAGGGSEAVPHVLPQPSDAAPGGAETAAAERRPSYVFFGAVAALSLLADVASKAWAEVTLSQRTMLDPSIELIKDHLSFTLAYNPGGAWGLLQNASESVRKPFFLAVSVLAIAFIVSLYSRLHESQKALKWGLPLVLGGALGNLSDRITRSSVIDFIDYRADWIASMNRFIADGVGSWSVTDHWPTFNVADIAICVGVGLMAVDMITSRRHPEAKQQAGEAKPSDTTPSAGVTPSSSSAPDASAAAMAGEASTVPTPADPNASGTPADPNASGTPADPNASGTPADPNASGNQQPIVGGSSSAS